MEVKETGISVKQAEMNGEQVYIDRVYHKDELEPKNNIELSGNKYIMVTWPDVQFLMDNPRWSECIFCQEIEGHPCPDSTYMIPEDLYNEIQQI